MLSITLVQGFKSPSNMNISNILNVNGHIDTKLIPEPKNKSHVNYSSIEPVQFKILCNIKLSRSIRPKAHQKRYNPLPIQSLIWKLK